MTISSTFSNHHDKSLGMVIEGEALDDDGNLSGNVEVYSTESGESLYEESVSGSFTIFLGPSPGVDGGGSVETAMTVNSLGFQFTPTFAGLAYTNDNLDEFHEISYSGVEGTITDQSGEPVKNASVSGNIDGTITDKEGYYSLLAPVGAETSLTSLKKSKEKSFTAPEDGKATVDWQFPGIRVRVQTPNTYEPISGVPVNIGGEPYTTEEDGEVTFKQAKLGEEYEIEVFKSDKYTDKVKAPDEEGSLTVVRAGPENSSFGEDDEDEETGPFVLNIFIKDTATNKPINNISVKDTVNGVSSSTNKRGKTKIISPTDDEDGYVELLAGHESDRYVASSKMVELTESEVDVEINLERRHATTQV